MEIKINLIPPYRKKEIFEAKRLKTAIKLEIFSTTIILLFFAFLWSINYILKLNMDSVSANIEMDKNRSQYEKIQKLEDEFVQANAKVSEIASLKKDQMYWSNLPVKLSDNVTEGITIEEVANKDYNVFLVGKADDRDNLIKFKEKISQEQCFSDVNLPLSNLVSKNNVDFQMDFKIKEDCLKNK